MFQRRKGNKYFWFHKQFVFFLILKLYLCLINQEKAHIFMDINEVHFIYFSPTRTSKQVGEAIVRGTGLTNVVATNLTLHAAEVDIPENTLTLIAVPVYGGKVAPCNRSFGYGAVAGYLCIGISGCAGSSLW